VIPEEDPIAEAVTVLTSRGRTVEPDDDYERWRVDDGDSLTAGDVRAWAIVLGRNGGVGGLQQRRASNAAVRGRARIPEHGSSPGSCRSRRPTARSPNARDPGPGA
jgi:hypothetical protein